MCTNPFRMMCTLNTGASHRQKFKRRVVRWLYIMLLVHLFLVDWVWTHIHLQFRYWIFLVFSWFLLFCFYLPQLNTSPIPFSVSRLRRLQVSTGGIHLSSLFSTLWVTVGVTSCLIMRTGIEQQIGSPRPKNGNIKHYPAVSPQSSSSSALQTAQVCLPLHSILLVPVLQSKATPKGNWLPAVVVTTW